MSQPYASFISVDEARERLIELGRSHQLSGESVPLGQAMNRVLTGDVVAPIAIPPFDNSAMDGYALRHADLPSSGHRDFILVGHRLAGDYQPQAIGAGECLRITTGAAIPDGADTVVIKEAVSDLGKRIRIGQSVAKAANVRPRGEDLAAGAVALHAGMRMTPARLGVVASLGFAQVDVVRRPRVVLITTGDELIAPGEPLGQGQIHNSNGYSIGAQLLSLGVQLVLPLASATPDVIRYEVAESPLRFLQVPDDRAALRASLIAAAAVADIIISSGGVSAGEADFLPGLLAELGQIHFWKVRMRPGMPLLCGDIDSTLMLGLPGNPVSSLASLSTLLAPALAAMQGMPAADTEQVLLASDLLKSHNRTEFVRARLWNHADGSRWASPVERQGSAMLSGMTHADGLLVIDEGLRDVQAGTALPWIPIR